jgi:hypothetical protein|tara:strand:+ start:389 stop:595 length:207 start_codon:yes stop_codon:yes gene_type:complete
MAKRTRRQRIVSHLKSAELFFGKADAHIAAASAIYFEEGYKEGAALEMVRKGCTMSKQAVEMFRRQFA